MSRHYSNELFELVLGVCEPELAKEIESHLRQCLSCTEEYAQLRTLLAVPGNATESAAPTGLRDKILRQVEKIPPYSVHMPQVAKLLGVSLDQVKSEFSTLPPNPSWVDGPIERCRLLPSQLPKAEDSMNLFVLMEAGSSFPHHHHLGEEHIVVLQGSLVDSSGRVLRPGDTATMPKGSSHSFEIPKGLDLVYYNVVRTGLRIGEMEIRADNAPF